MYNNGYVGTNEDSQRIRRQEKQREEQRKKFESLAKESKDRADGAGLRQFGTSTEEALENAFKNETVGLVTKADFVKKRTTLQERLEEEQRRAAREADEATAREKERRRKEKEGSKPKLSFMGEDEEGEGEGEELMPPPRSRPAAGSASASADGAGAEAPSTSGQDEGGPVKKAKLGKLGKDPTVSTEFLPDKERERAEAELRMALKKEWTARVNKEKAEPLEITYSYWDGTGHRREVKVTKGDSIGGFLKAVRDQLAPEFRELRSTSVDNLMYIKEDLIIPQHFTFYELIINKARGKSGPLFTFNVHEDIRITNDASREKMDSHAGKVVERHWYEKNKHIFPASRWEMYDPEKTYGEYSIYG